jgi:hypothetical protein
MSQKCNFKEYERKNVDTDGHKILLDVLNLVGIDTRSSLDRTNKV